MKKNKSTGNRVYDIVNPATVALYQDGTIGTTVGSGICIDVTKSGDVIILTAAHTILPFRGMDVGSQYQNNIRAEFTNAHTKKGISDVQEYLILLGCDVSADVAIMCTISHNFCQNQSCLKFAKQFSVGDDCYNVSTPFNLLENNISAGIIRNTYIIPYSVNAIPDYTNKTVCLMTDTAIAQGTSGGSFVNDCGEIVGMAQWKFIGTTSFAGGIHTDFLEPITNELIHLNKETLLLPSYEAKRIDFNGTTGKGDIGIGNYIDVVGYTLVQLTKQNKEFKESKYNRPYGIVVTKVLKGSGLDIAGVVNGDIITKIGNSILPIGDESVNVLLDIYFKKKKMLMVEWLHFIDENKMEVNKKNVIIGEFPLDREYISVANGYELVSSVGPAFSSKPYVFSYGLTQWGDPITYISNFSTAQSIQVSAIMSNVIIPTYNIFTITLTFKGVSIQSNGYTLAMYVAHDSTPTDGIFIQNISFTNNTYVTQQLILPASTYRIGFHYDGSSDSLTILTSSWTVSVTVATYYS
jgi:hypothetical protein